MSALRSQEASKTYLERLGVPVLDFLDGRHVAQIVRELVEFFDSVGETDGEFLCWVWVSMGRTTR